MHSTRNPSENGRVAKEALEHVCSGSVAMLACSSIEGSGSGDRYTMESPASGSINEVGWRFQSFRINDFELVDLTRIELVTS